MGSLTPDEYLNSRLQKLEDWRESDLNYLNKEIHDVKISVANLDVKINVLVAVLSPVALGMIAFVLQVILKH